jgi:hypothetical protein
MCLLRINNTKGTVGFKLNWAKLIKIESYPIESICTTCFYHVHVLDLLMNSMLLWRKCYLPGSYFYGEACAPEGLKQF